ncbi:MAG: TIGR02281 family clan AA aspartic protease [Hyphomicrobiaceae bacterium]
MIKWLPLLLLVIGGIVLVLHGGDGSTIAGLEASTFSSIVALGALVLFIGGAAVAGYNGRFFKALRDMAAWAVLVLALVAGYTYQAEFAEIAHRITGELMPPGEGQVVESNRTGERSIRFRRRADGHFVVRASINESSVNMLVDTGASTVVLRAEDARRIGLDVRNLDYSVPVQTANGMSYAAAVRLPSISIGPLRLDGVEALVARPGTLGESLLGMTFLRRLRSYEFSRDFLTMRG